MSNILYDGGWFGINLKQLDFQIQDAERAQMHYCGQGMQGGVDWDTSLQCHNSSHTYPQKCALETVLCSFW